MKVAVIATKSPANDYLILEIARQNDVIAVFHPGRPARSVLQKIDTLKRQIRTHGAVHFAMHKLSKGPFQIGWPGWKKLRQAEMDTFGKYAEDYNRVLSARSSWVKNVNSAEFCRTIENLGADVVVCSGGPIYRAPLIRACKMMLNYHTGISPIYNGAETNWWAYVNGHLQLCGGTLMVMNETVDGGDILGHFFTDVSPEDDPATTFCKAIKGGASLYNEFLKDLENKVDYHTVPQPKPFLYYKNLDWTLYQNLAVERQLRLKRKTALIIPEHTARYWRETSQEDAIQILRDGLAEMIVHTRSEKQKN